MINKIKDIFIKKNDKRKIPGININSEREYLYIADDKNNEFLKIFHTIIDQVNPRNSKNGGAIIEGCKIQLPNEEGLFHGISYKGDIEGWRKDFYLGTQALNLLTAKIVSNQIVISNGKSFNLNNCKIEFD